MDDHLNQLQHRLDELSQRLDAPLDRQKPKPGELPKLLRQIYRLRYNLLTNRIEANGEPINGNFLKTLWVDLERSIRSSPRSKLLIAQLYWRPSKTAITPSANTSMA